MTCLRADRSQNPGSIPGMGNIYLYVHGSVYRNIELRKEPTRCDRVVEFIIPMFLNCSTCFGRHNTHHQELKTVIAASGFYIRFCLTEAAITVFELLVMGGVSPETC